MQNNMQFNMQNMLAICRFGADCLVLTVICRICQIICSICPICYDDFQYAQYALPTLLMQLIPRSVIFCASGPSRLLDQLAKRKSESLKRLHRICKRKCRLIVEMNGLYWLTLVLPQSFITCIHDENSKKHNILPINHEKRCICTFCR